MKRLAITLLCTVGTIAAHADTFFDNARVRSAVPQYENITVPREECRTEWESLPQPGNYGNNQGSPHYGGAVLGALAGGVVGNQVARGNGGREAATALGALVGAIAGNNIAGRNNHYEPVPEAPRQVTRCQAVNDVQARLSGYSVAYDYRGQTYTTLMRDNPGPNLQVRVSVEPVGTVLR